MTDECRPIAVVAENQILEIEGNLGASDVAPVKIDQGTVYDADLGCRMSHTVMLEHNCQPGRGEKIRPSLAAALADTRARPGAGVTQP